MNMRSLNGEQIIEKQLVGIPYFNNMYQSLFSHLMEEHSMDIQLYGMIFQEHHVTSLVQNNGNSGVGHGSRANNACLETEPREEPSVGQNNGNNTIDGEISFQQLCVLRQKHMLCERKYHLSKLKVTFLSLPHENNNFFCTRAK